MEPNAHAHPGRAFHLRDSHREFPKQTDNLRRDFTFIFPIACNGIDHFMHMHNIFPFQFVYFFRQH